MKKLIIGFILGGLIFGSVGIYAASYYAKDVSYEPTDASWEVTNVSDALDHLYKNARNVQIGNLHAKLSGASIQKTINFDKPFTNVPTVAISRNDIPHSVYYSILSVTTTGFTVSFSTTDNNEVNATINWNWVAYE